MRPTPDPAPAGRRACDSSARRMSAALAAMGVLHFVRPEPFDGLIPPFLPGSARAWTHGSGVAELAVAGLLAVPRTRRGTGSGMPISSIAMVSVRPSQCSALGPIAR